MAATIEQSQRDRFPLENFIEYTPRCFRLRAFFAVALFMLGWWNGRLVECWAGEGQRPDAVPSVESRFEIIARESISSATQGEIFLEACEAADASRLLAVRVVVTASDGSHPDGSGRGVYSDGRFFAEGRFSVRVPPGKTAIRLSSGPDYVPLEMTLEVKAGKRIGVRVQLVRWFAPDQHGWFGGDNHVHAQHDAHALVRTDIDFAALQARADGLSYITEAGPVELTAAELDRLSQPGFLILHAAELRPACFVGHLNTPGIARPLADRLDQLIRPAIAGPGHYRGRPRTGRCDNSFSSTGADPPVTLDGRDGNLLGCRAGPLCRRVGHRFTGNGTIAFCGLEPGQPAGGE